MKQGTYGIELKGTPSVGLGKERTEKFQIVVTESAIAIKDEKGDTLISFAPFYDGGSVWLSDFSSIIMDYEHWGDDKEGKFKMLWKQEQAISTSTSEIVRWKEDSEKLKQLQESFKILRGEKQ